MWLPHLERLERAWLRANSSHSRQPATHGRAEVVRSAADIAEGDEGTLAALAALAAALAYQASRM